MSKIISKPTMTLVAFFGMLLPLHAEPKQDLTGNWEMTVFKQNGHEYPKDGVMKEKIRISFDKDKCTIEEQHSESKSIVCRYKVSINADKLDLISLSDDVPSIQAIFKRDGNTLTIAYDDDKKTRPKDLTGAPATGPTVMVFKSK